MQISGYPIKKLFTITTGVIKRIFLLIFTLSCFLNLSYSQTAGDFRAIANGNWNVNATWERYNGAAWVAAGATPTNLDGQTTILAGITVTVTAAVPTDQLVVDGTITIAAGQTLTLNNGAGTDMLISATGIVNINGTLTGTGSADVSGVLVNSGVFSVTGALNVLGGGRYQHNINGGTIPAAAWNATSICEVTGVTNTVPAGINQNFGDLIWNCTTQLANITANLNATLQGDLTITDTDGNDFILNTNLNLNNNNLTVGTNGVLNSLANQITVGTGTVTIDGTFKTTNINGFYGAANTTIVNTPNIFLNVGSTVDYTLNGAQSITATATFVPAGTNYSNLTTSTGGTKTLLNNVTVNNTLTIGAGSQLEVANRTLAVLGNTSILGTLADNNAAGIANLQNVTMQGGTINHTATAAVNIAGSLTCTGGSSTIGTANITITGATVINAGATLVNSGAGNKFYNGGITNNGTWSAIGAPNVRIQNGLTNNGTMSSTGAGTYTFNGTQIIAGNQPIVFQGSVNVPAGFTLTNNNTSSITFQGALTGGAGSTFANNTTMYYANNSIPMAGGNLNATSVGNNVYYSLAGDQPVRNTTYRNLFTSGSGIKTAGGAVTVQGNLNIGGGTTLADGGFLISVNGNITNGGSATGTGGISLTGGTALHTITGNGSFQRLQINDGAFNTSLVTTAASCAVSDLVLTAGTLSINNNTLTINNSIAGTPTNLIGGGTSSLVLNGTAAINVPTSITNLNNFTLNNTGGSALGANLDISGTVNLTNGALSIGAFNLTIRNTPIVTSGFFNTTNASTLTTAGGNIINIPASATPNVLNLTKNNNNTLTFNGALLNNVNLTAAGNFILGANVGVTGNWANPSANLNANTHTVTFNGAGAQAISGANNNFYTVDISKTGGTLTLTNDINIAGNWLFNTGAFDATTNLRTVNFNGTGAQNIGGLLSTTFYNLTVNNGTGPVSLTNSQTINNLLNLSAVGSKIYLGGFNLTMNTNSLAIAGVGASNYIVSDGAGKLIKIFNAATTAYTFPLGDVTGAAEYSPVSITYAGGGLAGAALGMRVVNDKDPNYSGTTDYLNRYWVASNEGGWGAGRNIDYTFTLGASDKIGNQANIYGAYYTGGAWTKNVAAIGAAANFSVTGISTNLLTADFSGIDNDPPSVVSITPNVGLGGTVTDAYVGANQFSLTIVYDEDMDPAAVPSVSFPTAGENPNPTIQFSNGFWSDTRTYIARYNVADFNLIMNNIDVSVSNGRDMAGNLQNPNPQTLIAGNGLNAFNINMASATVLTAVPNTALITDATPSFFITVTYSTAMNTTVKPTVTFPTVGENPNTDNTLSYDVIASSWTDATHFVAMFTLSDQGLCMNNVDIQVAGAQDVINNAQAVFAPPTPGAMNLFSISMGNPVNAGVDQAVCGTVNLNATPSVFDTRFWSCNQPGVIYTNSTNPSTVVTNLSPGINIFTWTVNYKGCTASDNVIVTNNQVTNVNAGNDQHVCATNATMAATGTGTWTRISGAGTVTLPNSSVSTVTGLGPGGNTFRWTVTQGACTGFDDVIIYNDLPSTSNAGAPQISCNGSAVLSANNPVYGTGSWTINPPVPVGATFGNSTVFNTTVAGLTSGINTLTWTIVNGICTSTSSVEIIYNLVPAVTAGPDQQSCNNSFTLNGTDPNPTGTGAWSVVQGVGSFVTASAYNSVVNLVGRGDNIFRWTVTVGGCSAFDDISISNYSVTANAGLDNYTCDATYTLQGNNPVTQNIANPPLVATGTWSALPAVPPIAFSNVNAFNAMVSNLVKDDNTLSWTISNGFCSATDLVDISNDMPTLPNAGRDSTFCGIDFPLQGYNSMYNSLSSNSPDLTRDGVGELGFWTQVAGASTFVDPTTSTTMRVDNLEYYAQLGGPDYWNLNPTVNTYRWTIQYKLCELYDEVTITNASPFPADAGPNQTVCWDDADLNAVDLGSGAQLHWWTANPPAGITFYDPLTSNVTVPFSMPFNSHVEGLQVGPTTFRWFKENTINTVTCRIWDETLVTRVASNLGATSAGPDQVVCSRQAFMQGSKPGEAFVAPPVYNVTGQWTVISGGGNFADANSYSTLVTNLNYDTNVLRWTLTNNDLGCIITNDVYITNALPSNANTGANQFVCTNTSLLSAERPTRGYGEWSVLGGGGTISNTTCVNFNCDVYVSNLAQGQNTFLWSTNFDFTDPASGIDSTCVLTDTITVWNNRITANAGPDQIVCVDNASLEANLPVGATGNWTVTGGSGSIIVANTNITTVVNLSPDLNTLTWTLTNGFCTNSDNINITNNNPENPNAGTDQTICTNTASLVANNPIAGMGTGQWSVIVGNGVFSNSLSATTIVNNIPVGANTYRWTITKGTCSEYDEVSVYNNSVVAIAGTDIDDVCGTEFRNSTVSLGATPPNLSTGETGSWSIANSFGTIQTPTAFNSAVNGMDRGENIFRWTLSHTQNGVTCTNSDLVSVFVYIPSTANAGGDQTVCRDAATNITLTGNNPVFGSGTWTAVSGGGNISNPTNFTTTVNNLALDRSFFRWSIIDNPSCPASIDDVMITNNYVTASAGPDQAICISTAQLAASDPNTYNGGFAVPSGKWTVSQGVGLTFNSDTRFDAIVSNLDDTQTNILRWTVTKGSCSAFDEVNIVNNEFTVTANADQTVCDDFTSLNGQQPSGGETGIWTVIGGGGAFVNNTLYNTQVNTLSVNPNTFRWTITRANCTASDDVVITNNKVTANAGLLQRVCSNTATLDGNDPLLLFPAGATGNWVATLGGASITSPSIRNTQVTNLAVGQNTFQWTISRTLNGITCSNASSVNIFNDTPSNAVVEADNEVCTNSTMLTVLNIPTVGTGVWSNVDNVAVFDNSLSYNANVSGLNRGINTFRWTVTNQACSSSDDVVITNNIVISDAGVDKSTACADFTTLSGNNPSLSQGSGLWVDLTGTTANIVNNTLYNTSITGLQQGTTQFQWTVSLGSCSVSDIVRITNNQITATAGVDQITCNDFYGPLDGNNVAGLGGTGLWTSIGNTANITNSTLFNTGVTGLDPGLNTFRWTVTSGAESCTDFDEVGITNSRVIANAGTDFETCNSTITLGAQDPTPASGFWTQTSGNPAVIVNSTSPTSQVTGLTGGVYAFTWTISNGSCSNSATVVVTNSSPQAAIANTGAPQVCNGNGTLVGNALLVGETGLWTPVSASGTIANASNNNTTVTGLQLGNNTFRWTIRKGINVSCSSFADVTITNNQVVANAGLDQNNCSTVATLLGNNPLVTQGSGLWTKIGANPAIIADATLYNTTISNLASNTSHGFTWTVTLGSCSASDDVYIRNNQVIAQAGADVPSCSSSVNLDGNDVSSVGAAGVWTKLAPSTSVIVNPSLYNTLITSLEPGVNGFRWTVTSAGGCTSSDDVEITYNQVIANAGLDQETCNPSLSLAALNPAPGTGVWTQIGGNPATIVSPTLSSTSITGMTGGNYAFRWTVTYNGCSGFDDVVITNSTPQTALANTGAAEVCDGNGTLVGNVLLVGETGLWTPVSASGTIINSSLNSTSVTGLGLGNNTFRWTIRKGINVSCSSFADVTITNNQVVANAGLDQDNCSTISTLLGNNPLVTQGSGLWTKIGANPAIIANATLYNTTISNLASNTSHGFTWTVTLGSCTASDDVYIRNNQVIALAGSDAPSCNSSVNLDGNDVSSVGATGVWTKLAPSTSLIVNPSLYNTLVTSLEPGVNGFRWTVTSAGGCTTSDDVEITYNQVIANAGLDQETCNSSLSLAALNPAPGTGVWTQIGGNPATIVSPTLSSTSITGMTSGNYAFRWTVTYNGCSGFDDVVITNSTPQTALANTGAAEVCDGNGTLVGNALLVGETGLWTPVSASGTIANASVNSTTVSGLGLGINTFRWTIRKGTNVSCSSSADVSITNSQVVAQAGVDQDLCTTTTSLQGNNPTSTQGTGIWTKIGINPSVIVDATAYNTVVNNLANNSSHGFTWTVSQGICSASDDVTIRNNYVVAAAGSDVPTCSNTVNLDGNDVSSVGAAGIWTKLAPSTSVIVNQSLYNTAVTSLDPGVNGFKWSVTSAGGCVSSDDVQITYNLASANAGLDQETCNPAVNLAALNPAPGTGVWTQIGGNPATIVNPTLSSTSITGLTGGNYAFRWTVTHNSCTASDDVVVVNSSPQTAIANTSAAEVCDGNGTLLGNVLQVGETGLWTPVSASGTIANASANSTTVSGLGFGINTFRWTIRKGTNVSCSSSADVSITNNQVISNAGADQNICTNTAALQGNNPSSTQGTGNWTKVGVNPATIVDATAYNTTITNLADNTSHGFTWTVSQGICSASDDVIIRNNRIVAVAGSDQQTCINTINLDGNDVSSVGATGVWTKLAPSTSVIVSPSLFNTAVNSLVPGVNGFRWTVTSSAGCVTTDDVEFTYNFASANAGLDQETCNSSVNLAAVPPASGSGSWSQVSGNAAIILNSTNANSAVTGLISGNYTFRWTVINSGCSAFDDVLIVNSQPQTAIALTGTPEICGGVATLIGNAPGAGETGLWTKVDATGTIVDPSSNNTSVSGLKSGTNIFMWTLTKGISTTCTSSATVNVDNNAVTANAFTTNNISCDGNASLTGNDPALQSATGLWTVSTGATISDPTANSITATNLATGANVFTWTVTRGTCVATSSVTITNNQVIATVSNTNINVCGNSATLNAFDPSPNSGIWTLEASDSPGVIIANNTLYNTNVSNITKTATFRWTVTNASCSDHEFVTVNNNQISLNDGAPQTICAFEGDLNAGSLDIGQTGRWTAAGSNPIVQSSTTPFTHVTNLDYGTNVFFWTVTTATGCSANARYDIINDSPSTPNAGVDQNLCSDFGTLSANNPLYGNGLWTKSGGSPFVVITDPTNSSTSVTNLGTGATTFIWTITKNSCVQSDDVILNNNLFTVATGVDQSICTDTSSLSIVSGLGGAWTRISGTGIISNSTDPNAKVTNLSFGQNQFQWTVTSGGCTVFDQITITNNSPEIPSTEVDKIVCQSSGVPISANSPSYGSGLWTAQGGTATILSPTLNNTSVNNLSNGINTLRWTLSYNGCSKFDELIITSNAVTATAGNDESLCSNSTSLNANTPLVGTGSWSVTSGPAIIANSLLSNSVVTNLAQGTNILRWTVSNIGCSAFDEVTITNNSPDVANAGVDIPTCTNTVNLIGNNPTVGRGVWSTNSSSAVIANQTLYNTSVTVTPGVTTFTWTISNNGCSSADDVEVRNNSIAVNVNPDDYTCNGSYNLLGTSPALIGTGTGTGLWTVVSGSGTFTSATLFNTPVTNLLSTGSRESILQWTVTDGACSAFDQVRITNDEVTASSIGFMTCNSTTTLVANDPGIQNASGIWSVDNQTTQTIAQPSSFITNVGGLVPNAVSRFRWTVSRNLCSASDTVNVEYFVPNANITIPDIAHGCADTIQLIADANLGGGTGVWSMKFGSLQVTIDDPTSTTTVARNLEIGNNVFVWTVTNRGCIKTDEVSINNSKPVNTAGSDQAACNNAFTMNAQTPTATGSGLWTLISGSVTFANPTLANTAVTAGPGVNIVQWTITDGGCSTSKQFTIANNLTNPNAGTDVPNYCQNSIQLAGNTLKPSETGTWSIDGGIVSEVFNSTSVNNPIVSNLRQGSITFVWTITNGTCTAEDRVVVTNNTPTVDAGPDRIICEDLVTLAGNNPDPGTTGEWTIGSGTVKIISPTSYNTNVTNLSSGSNLFTWTINNGICTASDNVLITSNSIDVVAGIPHTEDCADTLYLEATVPPLTGSGLWTAVEGGGTFDNPTSYSTIARNLVGFNKLRWTIVNGSCSFFNDIEFVSLLPTLAATQADKAVCTNSTQITANPALGTGESGLWTKVVGSSGVIIVNPTAFQTQVNNLDPGVNVFRWTISNSQCSTSDLIFITNNEVFADAGQDKIICFDNYSISANVTTGIGTWISTTPGVIIANSASANTPVSNLVFGNNNFQWIVNYNGCTDVDEVIITSDLPRNVSAGSDQNICSGSTSLSGTNPGIGTGLWTVTGGAGTFANASINQTEVTNLSTGENIFKWTVTVGSCSASSQIRVNNNSLYVTAGTDQTICNVNSLQLDGTIPGPGISGTWSVNGGTGTFANPSLYNTVVTNITKGTNTYRWTLTDGSCTNFAEVEVINNTPDLAIVGADQLICTDNTIINAIAVSNGTGSWSVSSGSATIVNPLSNNTAVTGINKGLNTFTWTVSKNGCSLSDDINVNNNAVNAYIANDNIVVCNPLHSTVIIGNSVGTGETGFWTKISAGPGVITNSASNVTTVTALGNGETFFRWTVQNANCSFSDDLKITDNYYNTTANPAGDSVLCVNYSPVIGGSLPVGATGLWSSTSADVSFDNPNLVATVARNLPGGTSSITWTVTKDGCSSPASFRLFNNAIYTSAGSNQIVCVPNTTLNAQKLLPGESGVWTVNNTNVVITNTANPGTAVSNLISGDNTFTWTLSGNGCTVSQQVIVSNNAFTVTAGIDNIICDTTYNLAASDPLGGTGLWTVTSGTGTFVSNSSFATRVYNISNGSNTYVWTANRNGCVASDTIVITNNKYLANAGADRAICSNQTTVSAQPLNPVWGANGSWSALTGGGIFTNQTAASTLVTGLSTGINRLRWTVTKGTCTHSDDVEITNNSVTATAGTDEVTCNSFATLSATPLGPGGKGFWSGGGFTAIIENTASPTTQVTHLQQGVNTFSWTVTENNCTGTSTVRITSNFFSAKAGNDQNLTVDNTVMSAKLPSVTATGTWSIFAGNGTFANINDPSSAVTNLGYGINTFRWTVVWNGCTALDDVNITYNAITAEAGPNQVICSDKALMNADDPSPGNGIWSVLSGGGIFTNPASQNTQVTGILPGSVNIYRWTVFLNGYSEYDDVTIINSEFTINAGVDLYSCNNTSVLSAEPAGATGNGTWSVLAGSGNFTNPSLHNTAVTNLGEGPNLFVWTVVKSTGCFDSDTIRVTYNTPPTADFITDVAGGCSPVDVLIRNNSSSGQFYYWTYGNGSQATHTIIKDTTITYIAPFDYQDEPYTITLVAFDSDNCSDTISRQVTAFRIPRVDFSPFPTAQPWPGSTIQVENLSGTGYPNYYWDFGDGNNRLDNTMVSNFTYTYSTWGHFEITLAVTSATCSDTARYSIDIYPPLPKNVGGRNYAGCDPYALNFVNGTQYADSFYWDMGDGGHSNEPEPQWIYDSPGRYIVSLYAWGPGSLTDSVFIRHDTVDVFPTPVADFLVEPDTVMLPNQAIYCYNRSSNADFYEWNFGDNGNEVFTDENPIHFYTKSGTYNITLRVYTNTDPSCPDSKTINAAIVVEEAGVCKFPNAFSPNPGGPSDGRWLANDVSNDIFHPVHRGIHEYKLEIFNRWGEKIFESKDPAIGWDGYRDGKLSPQDVYVWKVTGKYRNGVIFKDAGDVTLIR